MHIALIGEISRRKSPILGGTGIDLVRTANKLHERSYNVTIITSSSTRFRNLNIRVHENINYCFIGFKKKPYQLFLLSYYLLKIKPDIVIARDSKAILLCCWYKKYINHRICLISSIHNENAVRLPRKPSMRKKKSIRMDLIKKYSDGILCVSPGIREAVLNWIDFHHELIQTIPTPIDLHDTAPKLNKNGEFSENPSYQIVNIGRLNPEKGQKYIIYALYRLLYDYKADARLTIIGEGPLKENLTEIARELGVSHSIHFTGYISNPIPHLANADLFVSASLQEAFGLAILEALGVGVPVVSTDCPYGPRYILDNGKYGSLVPLRDSCALADSMYKDLKSNHDHCKLKSRAKEFDISNIMHHYSEYIENVYSLHKERYNQSKQ